MRRVNHFIPLAILAALLAAAPTRADEDSSGLFGTGDVDLVAWQTTDDPWAGYHAQGGGTLAADGAAGCGEVTGCDGAIGCDGPICCRRSGLIAGMEMPLLQAHTGAISIREAGWYRLPKYTPDFDHEATPRFWLGYETCDGLSFRWRYWQYDHTTSAVDAKRQYYVEAGLAAEDFDFEIAQRADLGNWEFELAGGARYAKLSDDLRISWDGDLVLWERGFEGGGPTFALAARRPLALPGFGLVADFRASFIYGDTRAELLETVDDQIITEIWTAVDDQVTEIYEIQVGADWSCMTRGGWELTGRLVLEGQVWALAPGPAPLDAFDTTIGFVGPSFSLAIER